MIIKPSAFDLKVTRCRHTRRGVTLVEAAISLGFICTLIIGCIDFSIAAFRSEVLNHVAHKVGRSAVIHGTYAPTSWNGGPWGPSEIETTMLATDPVASVASGLKTSLNHASVTIKVIWPNGKNAPGNPVLVETRMTWSPMFLESMGIGVLTLRGRSYQIIQH